jgi:hypothetical protein
MAKNYFAVVNPKTKKLIVIGNKLPLYWIRSEAKRIAEIYKGDVIPVSIDELEKIIKTKVKP